MAANGNGTNADRNHGAPQTNNEVEFEVGESSDAITNHNIQLRSPIGLNLRLTSSLINQIESTLKEHYKDKGQYYKENGQLALSQVQLDSSKLKASNMPAIFLKIGAWKWASKNEGDLVVKFYYGKKKLVWEFLFGCRKKKIEIRWSQISAINTFVEEDNKSRLEIELIEPPEFCDEIKFQPKKHTQWAPTKDDFTEGQAPICRRHTVVFPSRVLDEPLKKLLQSDTRLFNLSQQPFPAHNYPHFQNQFLDFSCNKSVHGFSSGKDVNNDHHGAYVPNLIQPADGVNFVGHSSSSNLQIQVSNSPYLDEKATGVSYESIRTNGVLEQSGNNQIQEISVTPIENQDNFLQNRGMESWSQSHLPEHKALNQSFDQKNYMTSVDQSYVDNGIIVNGPDPWLHVEAGVGFDYSSGSQVMNDMPYGVDDEAFINAGLAFQESIDWPPDFCLNEFDNGGSVNGLNHMGYADNGIQRFQGNGDYVLFPNSNSNSNINSNGYSSDHRNL